MKKSSCLIFLNHDFDKCLKKTDVYDKLAMK